MWMINAPAILSMAVRKNFFHFGISKYSCEKTYPRKDGHGKRKKFTDYRDRWQHGCGVQAVECRLWGAGCDWCLDGGKGEQGETACQKRKKQPVCTHVHVCMRVWILVMESRGDKTNKTKLWSSGSNVSIVTERKPSGWICIPPINETMLVPHQKWTKKNGEIYQVSLWFSAPSMEKYLLPCSLVKAPSLW